MRFSTGGAIFSCAEMQTESKTSMQFYNWPVESDGNRILNRILHYDRDGDDQVYTYIMDTGSSPYLHPPDRYDRRECTGPIVDITYGADSSKHTAHATVCEEGQPGYPGALLHEQLSQQSSNYGIVGLAPAHPGQGCETAAARHGVVAPTDCVRVDMRSIGEGNEVSIPSPQECKRLYDDAKSKGVPMHSMPYTPAYDKCTRHPIRTDYDGECGGPSDGGPSDGGPSDGGPSGPSNRLAHMDTGNPYIECDSSPASDTKYAFGGATLGLPYFDGECRVLDYGRNVTYSC